MSDREALYIISVAARLVDLHPSTLRKYERVGFVEPSRLGGKLRLYSMDDIQRLRQIKYLVEERGINLAGIELALELTEGLRQLLEMLESAGQTRETRRLQPLVEHLLRLLGAGTSSADDTSRVASGIR